MKHCSHNKRKRCEMCARKHRAEVAAVRAERIRLGICIGCGQEDAAPGYRTCDECRAKGREYNARRRAVRQAQGLCRACGKPHKGKAQRCKLCTAAEVTRQARTRYGQP